MPLRVLHAVDSLRSEAGSVAISLHGLFDVLRDRGIESRIVTLDGAAEGAGAGADETDIPCDTAAGPKDAARLLRRVDVVHLHGWGRNLARAVAVAARNAAAPFVISPHGGLGKAAHNEKSRRDKLRERLGRGRIVRRAAAVTALNETEEYELRTRRVHPNIVLLPYGVHVSDYDGPGSANGVRRTVRNPASASTGDLCGSSEDAARVGEMTKANSALPRGSPNGHVLLVLAPIHPAEGFIPLLKALSELGAEANGWDVAFAGRETGAWRKMLEAAVRRKGGTGRVRFVQARDVAAQRAWLQRASILAAPSLRTRFPASVMQAVALGVPVIATTCVAPPGLEDVIRVCAPTRGDIKAGLRALLAMSEQERSAMARRARESARSVFDWSALVGRYVQLYQSIA